MNGWMGSAREEEPTNLYMWKTRFEEKERERYCDRRSFVCKDSD